METLKIESLNNCDEFFINYDDSIVATCDDFNLVIYYDSHWQMESEYEEEKYDPYRQCVNEWSNDQEFLRLFMLNHLDEVEIQYP